MNYCVELLNNLLSLSPSLVLYLLIPMIYGPWIRFGLILQLTLPQAILCSMFCFPIKLKAFSAAIA